MLSSQDFPVGAQLHGFAVESSGPLSEIDGFAHVMRHKKSGARLLFLQNDDDNKAFSIAFKTPPADDTGVFHILEHSVLCGSEKFPVKEPFVDLLKTSMQTFLNALTFPDKTMYPVASTNEQDLLNLADVYMDAVLDPAIYAKPEIFRQEGWHYELDEASECERPHAGAQTVDGGGALLEDEASAPFIPENDADYSRDDLAQGVPPASAARLRYNGVVFNEMKGALSDPDSVLYHAVNKALFPDTCYAFESGGHPRAIPKLTYEQFLDTHARHYRLDNAYIVLYGNLDADRMLAFLDERYLSACEPRTDAAPNAIGVQAPLVVTDVTVSMDTAPENACVGLGYVVGDARDFERVLACDVLLDALMGGNESPMKRALLDEGFGGDVTAYLMDSQAQPVAMFQLKNAEPGVAAAFMEAVEREAAHLVRDGIPRDVLEASLAQMAFDLRERDRGMADGVPLAMNALAGWLYDDGMATTYLRYEDALAHMRAGLDGRYFEDALESLVCSSGHKALVDLVPAVDEGESEEEAELACALAAMDDAAKQGVRDEVAALRAMQEAPDSPEAASTLPRLRVSDIGAAVPDPAYRVLADTPLPCLHHDLPTRHIDYLYLYFNADGLGWDDLPYVTLLGMLLARLGTARRTAADLDVHMRTHLGSLRFFADAFADETDPSKVGLKMTVAASALTEELEYLADIPREVWAETKLRRRIEDSRHPDPAPHRHGAVVHGRGPRARHEPPVVVRVQDGRLERADGRRGFLPFPVRCDRAFRRALRYAARTPVGRARPHLHEARRAGKLHGVERRPAPFLGARGRFWPAGRTRLFRWAPAAVRAGREESPQPEPKREAFVVPGDVCYVAKGADVHDASSFDGAWTVLSNALSFDYLWNEVRVKGGAYGVGFRRTPEGFGRFYSFRDPGVDATVARYDAAGEWLARFDPSEEEMEGYIVSTVAAHDAPVKPRQAARRQDAAFFCGKPADYRERLRGQKLASTPEKLRSYAEVLDRIARDGAMCAFGGEDVLRASKYDWNFVKLL